MKTTKTIRGWLVMAAALAVTTMGMTACSGDDSLVENMEQPAQPMTTEVTVTVGASIADDNGDATTRSTVDDSQRDANDKIIRTLKFTKSDKLYVYRSVDANTKLAGELTMVTGSRTNDNKDAQFTGTLKAYDASGNEKDYTFGSDPLEGTTATLVHYNMNTSAISITLGKAVTYNYSEMKAGNINNLMTKSLKVTGSYDSQTQTYTLTSSDPIFYCLFQALNDGLAEYTVNLKYQEGGSYKSAGSWSFTSTGDGIGYVAFASPKKGNYTWKLEIYRGSSLTNTIEIGSKNIGAKVYNLRRTLLDAVYIEGVPFYYVDGETWRQAITNHPAPNSGFGCSEGGVSYYGSNLYTMNWIVEIDDYIQTYVNPDDPILSYQEYLLEHIE